MDQFEREDSSTYSEPGRPVATEPVKEETPVQPPVQEFPKEKKSKAPLVLSVLLILALAGAGVLGWLWYQQNGEVDNVRADLASAKNKISQLESTAAADAKLDDSSDITTDTSSSSSDTILEKAIEYSAARTGNQGFVNGTSSREGKIDKQTDTFAKVTVSSPTSPGTETIYLKSAKDSWIVIGDGTEELSTLESGFGLPKGF